MKVTLDTCAFLWLALQPKKLPPTGRSVLDDPMVEQCLSRVSVMEIVMKHRAGKLPLTGPPALWVPSRCEFFQITDFDFGERAIYRSGLLPAVHDDPFERLLAAHAIELGATILTPDEPISALGAARLW